MQGTNAYITATPHGNYVDRLTSKLICMPIPTPAKLLLPSSHGYLRVASQNRDWA